MNKPRNFETKIYISYGQFNEKRSEIINNICDQYGFIIDYHLGSMFCGANDNIYENLQSRMIFILRELKKANIEVLHYKIKCAVYDSKIDGNLI